MATMSFYDDAWDEEEDTLQDRYLTFTLADDIYGLEVRYVTEIVPMQPITPVPEMPEYVRGVINLRGRVIPVLDIRLRFQMMPREYDDRTCIIISELDELDIGLIVDRVDDVVMLPEEDVAPPPPATGGPVNRCIMGMGRLEEVVHILLDVRRIIYDNDKEQVASAAHQHKESES